MFRASPGRREDDEMSHEIFVPHNDLGKTYNEIK